MARLKPTTRRNVERIATELGAVAADIEPARPFLAAIYRSLEKELDRSLTVPDAPFVMQLPPGATIETVELGEGEESVAYPKNFDAAKYHERLVRGMSDS